MIASPPTALREFQHAFAAHLRDPRAAPRPAGVPARRMAAYNELLINNLRSFLDRCFPVCRELLGAARWARLCRAFYRDAALTTPWFREIPRVFVAYLAQAPASLRLPRWCAELAHYEWVELAADIAAAPPPAHDAGGDLLAGVPVLNPTLHNLAYAWPVHRIGAHWRPRRPQATWLLVHRDADDTVRFTESSAATHRLLALLAPGQLSGAAAIDRLGAELAHPDPARLRAHGAELLAQLHTQGVILGTLLR